MARANRETWAKRVEAWKSSGLSAPDYAKKIGVRAKLLSWWRWRLGQKWRVTSRARRTAPATVTFVELSSAMHGEPLEVVLRNGVRVRVAGDFDVEVLKRLIGVLDGQG